MTKYSVNTENCAKAYGNSLPISRKESVMVCKALKGMQVQSAKKYLAEVIALKKPIAFTRYNGDMGHRKGIAAGSFPVSTCTHILNLLKSAESNAQFKGMGTAQLVIKHASAHKGPTAHHYGRQRTKAKRTHIELMLEERKSK